MAQKDEFVTDGDVPGGPIVGISGDATSPLDAVDLPIILTSRDCKITSINRPASKVLGLTAAHIGTSIGNVLARVKDLEKICARVIADGAPHRIESRDGDRCFLVRIAPCCGSDRKISGAALAFTNVTAFRASIDQAIYEREYTKAILNTVVDPLVVLDSNLQIQTANRAFYSLFGLSRDEANGVSIRKLGNRDWQNSEAWKSIEGALSLPDGAQSHSVAIDCEFPSIGSRTITVNARPLTREGNALLLLTLQDVTERKKAERATSLLAAIVGSSDDAIISKKLDGTITSWNDSAQRLFGYTAQEAIGQHITLIVPWERRSEEEEILRRLARGERVDHFETVRRRKDGTTLDVSLTISPIYDSAGRAIGASNVARDFSEKKRNERALQESEERFRAIVETTPECVKLVAADGTLLHMNSPGLQMVGARSAEEVLGKNIYELIAPEDRERFKAFNEAVCGGKQGSLQFDIIGLEGKRLHMESHAAPLRDPRGTIVHLAVSADISERKRAEEALRQSEARFAGEAAALVKLNESSSRLWRIRDLQQGLQEILAAVIDLLGANKGNIQLLDPDRRLLTIAAQRGFDQNFLDVFREVCADDDSACGRALRLGSPIVIEDVDADELFAPYRSAARAAKFRSVISTPLLRVDGKAIGMVSAHFASVHSPTDQDLRRMDLYVRQAADFIQRCETEDALRQSEEKFRQLAQTLDTQVRARTRELEQRNTDILKQAEKVTDLSRRLLQTQDEERRHIARELHDSAGQTLTVLGMNLAQLVHKAGRTSPELATEAENTQELVQQLHREIRTTSYLLHPPMLDENGLSSALSWYIDGLRERTNLTIDLSLSEEIGRLPRDMELAIFRIVQECLTNIHRHSGGKTALIKLARDADTILVEVQDSGNGISPQKLAELQAGGSGVGIAGMRERVRQLGGKMNIDSDSSGTRVSLSFPTAETPLQQESDTIEPLRARV
jgi:PAS domain S-box-containing protein